MRQPLSTILLALLTCLATAELSEAARRAIDSDEAPFKISVVDAGPAGDEHGRNDLSVELYVSNTSPQALGRIEVLALVVSPRGQAKGFHTFTLPVDAAAGERVYALYRTGQYSVSAGDKVVLLPYAAMGRGLDWRSDAERIGYLAREVEAAVRDGSHVVWSAANNPPEPGLDNPINHCTSMCSQANTTCQTNCRCGIQSASCTCSRESISSSCTCFQCPPNTD